MRYSQAKHRRHEFVNDLLSLNRHDRSNCVSYSPDDKHMNRSLLIVALLLHASPAMAAPNIVLMMGDDHGWEETGYNGHPLLYRRQYWTKWPTKGLRLDRFLCRWPSCLFPLPAASVLTGRHPNRYGHFFAPGLVDSGRKRSPWPCTFSAES